MATLTEVDELIAETFEVKAEELKDEMTMDDVDSWDSMRQIMLITSIEELIGTELSFDEISEMNSIGNIRKIVGAKLN